REAMDFVPVPPRQRRDEHLPFAIQLEVPALAMDIYAPDFQRLSEPPHDVRPALLRISSKQPRGLCSEGADGAGISNDVIGYEATDLGKSPDGGTQFPPFRKRDFLQVPDQIGEQAKSQSGGARR